ncbi:MAG: hypothetical protein IJT73_08430 [Selenomonadaceae bacterium]|nr:hypothetical protein [Selenomonadaceae bacterium]
MNKVSSSPIGSAISTKTVEYITESGKKVTENEYTVKPSKSGAVAGAAAGAAIAGPVGAIIGGIAGWALGPAD